MQQKALIAMSGGVDSSVAAYWAGQAGFACIGATMQLHPEDASRQISDAQSVAQKLGIPFYAWDYRKEFRTCVMDAFVNSYESGMTPNPCVVCNRYLKFGAFMEKAMELGCDYVVTGHYARIVQDSAGRFMLKKAVDEGKDQSYFLYALTQKQLAHTLFPLGELSKVQAREIAEAQGFLTAKKKDSQDICFVPDGSVRQGCRPSQGCCRLYLRAAKRSWHRHGRACVCLWQGYDQEHRHCRSKRGFDASVFAGQ